MSDLDAAERKVQAWLKPLPDAAAPCGPDLEYDNQFLALQAAIAGKPETQFAPAEPPDWRGALGLSEELLDRSRDLRIAIAWMLAAIHAQGFEMLAPGLRLLEGLLAGLWDHLHPMPDPEDKDPFARVNALTLLRENDGLVGTLRAARIAEDRALGRVTGRSVEVACGLSPARPDEKEPGREQITQMLAGYVREQPEVRGAARDAVETLDRIVKLAAQRLAGDAPDLKPVAALLRAILSLMPPEPKAAPEPASPDAGTGDGGAAAADASPRRGLSGEITTREEAIRAIEMVCAYLERAEPTNPATLFLRRAGQLISADFMELVRMLAPQALPDVARIVGIDPESFKLPDKPAPAPPAKK
jgi:type VI secretion system protein ImpA